MITRLTIPASTSAIISWKPGRLKVVPEMPSSAAVQKGLIISRRTGLPAQGFQQRFNLIGKVQPDIHAPVRVDGDGLQQIGRNLSGQRCNTCIALELLDYGIAADKRKSFYEDVVQIGKIEDSGYGTEDFQLVADCLKEYNRRFPESQPQLLRF